MSTGSWPLDLFWILSVAIMVFALAAYILGELFDRRRHNRQKDSARTPRASHAGGVRS